MLDGFCLHYGYVSGSWVHFEGTECFYSWCIFPHLSLQSDLLFLRLFPCPSLESHQGGALFFFLLCWVYTVNIICWMDFFFSTGNLQREPITVLSLRVINSGASPISPKHLSNLFILYTRAFRHINFTVHHLTLFVINIPQWLNHHFMVLCPERASTKLLPTHRAHVLRVLVCISEIFY